MKAFFGTLFLLGLVTTILGCNNQADPNPLSRASTSNESTDTHREPPHDPSEIATHIDALNRLIALQRKNLADIEAQLAKYPLGPGGACNKMSVSELIADIDMNTRKVNDLRSNPNLQSRLLPVSPCDPNGIQNQIDNLNIEISGQRERLAETEAQLAKDPLGPGTGVNKMTVDELIGDIGRKTLVVSNLLTEMNGCQ